MPPLLTLGEAAAELRMSASGLRKLVNRSKRNLARGKAAIIKFSQHGQSRILFRREWLDEYIEAGVAEPVEVVPVERRRAVRMVGTVERKYGF
jgi:hypothetical protein